MGFENRRKNIICFSFKATVDTPLNLSRLKDVALMPSFSLLLQNGLVLAFFILLFLKNAVIVAAKLGYCWSFNVNILK